MNITTGIKLRILIADDRAAIRDYLKGILNSNSRFDISYLEAGDGLAAVELYSTHRADIVYLDIQMPVLTGLEALKKMLEIDPKAFVVMISSEATVQNVQKAIESGAKAFIAKPYTAKKITDILEHVYLRRREITGITE